MDTAEVRLGENKTGRRRLSRRKKKYNFCVLDWAGHIFGTALLCQPGRVVCQKVSHQVIIQLIHEYLILVHILGQVYQIIGLVNVILGKIKRQL